MKTKKKPKLTNEKSEDNLSKKILQFFCISIFSMLSILLLRYLMNSGNIFIVSPIILSIVAVFGFYFYKNGISLLQSTSYFSCLIFILCYLSLSVSINAMLPSMASDFNILSATKIASFDSIFSLTYGLIQILAGYCLEKGGMFTIGLAALMAGISTWSMGFATSYTSAYFIRGLMGMFCSFGSIGMSSFISKYMPTSSFNILVSASSALAMLFGGTLNNTLSTSIQNGSVTWAGAHKTIGMIMIGGAAIGLICSIIYIVKNSNSAKVQNNSNKEEDSKTITLPMKSYIKLLLSPEYICSLIWTSSCCVLMYLVRILDNINSIAHSVPNSGLATSVYSITCAILLVLLPNLISTFPATTSYIFPIVSSIQLVGFLVLILCYKMGPWAIAIAASCFSVCGFTHVILPMIIEKRNEGNNSLSFGIFNFFTMFIGCYLSKQLIGFIVDRAWLNLGGKITEQGGHLYEAIHYVTAIKWLAPVVIITLITSFFVITINKTASTK